MPALHERRRERLTDVLTSVGLGSALITTVLNVRYLTGFTGSAAALLVTVDGSAEIATDSRYALQVQQECSDVPARITRSGRRELAQSVCDQNLGAAGFEDQCLSVAAWRDLPPGVAWTPLDSALDQLRMAKDAAELDLLRVACSASDAALDDVLPRLHAGVSEREVARWIDDGLRDRSEGPAFDTIVASGPNGAIPHHQPTERPIEHGDFVTMDFGARVGGYHADMTRTVVVGEVAHEWQRETYDIVRRAQQAGIDALGVGRAAADVDAAAREVIVDAGFGAFFDHGLGHGVGLQIHEAPFLGATSPDNLVESVPVTVEPGIYLPGRGGVRIEDTVVVHADHVEYLTTTTRDLLVVG
ncbi:MAG: aminopeptidase P family protein [Actinomycetia bacterium]|nr:aminopeptidase P family protein [Actinomycetes bacterium]